MVFCEENSAVKKTNIPFFFFIELITLHQGLIISEMFTMTTIPTNTTKKKRRDETKNSASVTVRVSEPQIGCI